MAYCIRLARSSFTFRRAKTSYAQHHFPLFHTGGSHSSVRTRDRCRALCTRPGSTVGFVGSHLSHARSSLIPIFAITATHLDARAPVIIHNFGASQVISQFHVRLFE